MNKKMKKLLATGLVSIGVGTGLMANVHAGTVFTNYDLTVPRFSGNAYTSYNQTKTTTRAAGNIRSTSVGGGYTIRARMQSSSYNGAFVNIQSGTNTPLPAHNNHYAGNSMRLNLRNQLTTTVNVQARGSWRSN